MKLIKVITFIVLVVAMSSCSPRIDTKEKLGSVQGVGPQSEDTGTECLLKPILSNWATKFPRAGSILNSLNFHGFSFDKTYTLSYGVNAKVSGDDYDGEILLSHKKTVDIPAVGGFDWEFYMKLTYHNECSALTVCYEGWYGEFPGFGTIDLPDSLDQVSDLLPYDIDLGLTDDLSSLFGGMGEIFNQCVTFE